MDGTGRSRTRIYRSESRNDILDSDHSLYDHGSGGGPLYYQPAQYTGFVRTCDGKFIRKHGRGQRVHGVDPAKQNCVGGSGLGFQYGSHRKQSYFVSHSDLYKTAILRIIFKIYLVEVYIDSDSADLI